jgi:hypothetical protein
LNDPFDRAFQATSGAIAAVMCFVGLFAVIYIAIATVAQIVSP